MVNGMGNPITDWIAAGQSDMHFQAERSWFNGW